MQEEDLIRLGPRNRKYIQDQMYQSHAIEEDLNKKLLGLESKLSIMGKLKGIFDDPLKMPKFLREDYLKLKQEFESDYNTLQQQKLIPIELIADYGKTLLESGLLQSEDYLEKKREEQRGKVDPTLIFDLYDQDKEFFNRFKQLLKTNVEDQSEEQKQQIQDTVFQTFKQQYEKEPKRFEKKNETKVLTKQQIFEKQQEIQENTQKQLKKNTKQIKQSLQEHQYQLEEQKFNIEQIKENVEEGNQTAERTDILEFSQFGEQEENKDIFDIFKQYYESLELVKVGDKPYQNVDYNAIYEFIISSKQQDLPEKYKTAIVQIKKDLFKIAHAYEILTKYDQKIEEIRDTEVYKSGKKVGLTSKGKKDVEQQEKFKREHIKTHPYLQHLIPRQTLDLQYIINEQNK